MQGDLTMKGIFRCTAMGGEEMVTEIELPFVPAVGAMLAVTDGGDYLRVEDVYWNCAAPDEIIVFMTDESGDPSAAYLREQGWRLE